MEGLHGQELLTVLKNEFQYIHDFDMQHFQLDEIINNDIKCGFVYHTLTPYGKLCFSHMHTAIKLDNGNTTIHPLCGHLVVNVNDDMLGDYPPDAPTCDFAAYTVSDDKTIDYYMVTALFDRRPMSVNEFFDAERWTAYHLEPMSNTDRLDRAID